jgi:hypothetical protein
MAIAQLPEIVDALAPDERARFDRIYSYSVAEGHLHAPETMVPWIKRTFGNLDAVETQRIIRVSNRVTGEGTLFNELRARRPVRSALQADGDFASLLKDDAWEDPLASTPADVFGRLSNQAGITAANVAKYDAVHSIIVFTEADPLAFTRDSVVAQTRLAREWIDAAHKDDPAAIYPYLMWNCLWRAGGSIVHGHTQASLARGRHYAKIERLRQDAARYRAEEHQSYFEDLRLTHTALGLGRETTGIFIAANLTPIKEKECLLIADELGDDLAAAMFSVLATFRDSLGVQSFNVGVLMPPIAPSDESWDDFPVVIRIVDRGNLETRTSDIGAMEMFAESVVAADPFSVSEALGEANA